MTTIQINPVTSVIVTYAHGNISVDFYAQMRDTVNIVPHAIYFDTMRFQHETWQERGS